MLHARLERSSDSRYILYYYDPTPGFLRFLAVSRGSGRAVLNELLTSDLGRQSTPTRPQLPDRPPPRTLDSPRAALACCDAQVWSATADAQHSESAEVRDAARAHAPRQYLIPAFADAPCCPRARQGEHESEICARTSVRAVLLTVLHMLLAGRMSSAHAASVGTALVLQ